MVFQFHTGSAGNAAGQQSKDAMEALQAAASELFRRFNEFQVYFHLTTSMMLFVYQGGHQTRSSNAAHDAFFSLS